MNYLLGIDFGGSASKAALIDTNGAIIAENTVEYPTIHPENGACEQNPRNWLSALCENIGAILEKSGISAKRILAVAVDSATHTSVLCDGNFQPLRNAVHWTDTRSGEQADRLRRELGDEIFEKCFHKPDTIWTLPQLLWLKEKEPEIYSASKYIFFEKDYIRYFLTGEYCTDSIEAQGSMLYDCRNKQWDKGLCALAGLTSNMLPPIKEPCDLAGTVTGSASKATGLAAGTPVICGTTDTALEILASGAVNKGDITVKLATAGRICVITDKPYPDRHLVNYSHILPGLWYPGTATKSCAASYRWFRDTFGGNYRQLDEIAATVPISCEGLIFHPYLNGELTPYADPALCASFTGVRATHTKAHFTRAVLEGVAYSLMESKRYLDQLHIPYNTTATAIGGGAGGRLWCQMIADVMGIALKTTESSDSSLGSAMLAGMAAGVFKNAEEAVNKCVHVKEMIAPNPENTSAYHRGFHIYRRIHDALAPIYSERIL